MKTVVFLAGLVALAVGGAIPHNHEIELRSVDAKFVEIQKKVLSLVDHVGQMGFEAEYYKLGKEYNIEANIERYSDKQVVEEFLNLYRNGFMPKHYKFSVFYEEMRDEAIVLFRLLYAAKDFETFYKTAAWSKVHLNTEQFLYAYYIAVFQRADTNGIALPAPYEVYPDFFINGDVFAKLFFVKMEGGVPVRDESYYAKYGIVKEDTDYVLYSNYSNSLTYPNEEQRLSYFTEDVGLNSYYYYFHSHLPFWWNSEKYGAFKERRGELYFFYYQQLLARYYLERLTNGLGDIPEFTWYGPYKTGYLPYLNGNFLPFAQRSNYYDIHTEKNYEQIRFLDTYEKTFYQYLQSGHFKAFENEVDFHTAKSSNFVGNYWQGNADLYHEDVTKDYQQSYEIVARHVLGGSPKPFDKYTFLPSALDFYQTSLRDPAFYQLYQRIIKYFVDYKKYLTPYTYEDLHFVGVKINDVHVSELVTYFDHYDINATQSIIYKDDELYKYPFGFKIRQPRLNHEPFTVTVDVKSDVGTDAVFKIFLGPKYDNEGYPINIEENWTKFYELDWFMKKLNPGENKIVRSSHDFISFKDDSVSIRELYKYLDEGKVPHDMSLVPFNMPNRLMLPRGTKGGYPFQLFVFVYPFNGVPKETEEFQNFVVDNKPFGYPFDRPVRDYYFKQPNMFYKDISIYHKEPFYPYELNVPSYYSNQSQ